MSTPETNSGIEKRRVSALGIASLGSSIIAAIFAFLCLRSLLRVDMEYHVWKAVWRAMWVCVALSYTCGIAGLIQRGFGGYYRRLWWLALFGAATSTGVLVCLAILAIALIVLGPK